MFTFSIVFCAIVTLINGVAYIFREPEEKYTHSKSYVALLVAIGCTCVSISVYVFIALVNTLMSLTQCCGGV